MYLIESDRLLKVKYIENCRGTRILFRFLSGPFNKHSVNRVTEFHSLNDIYMSKSSGSKNYDRYYSEMLKCVYDVQLHKFLQSLQKWFLWIHFTYLWSWNKKKQKQTINQTKSTYEWIRFICFYGNQVLQLILTLSTVGL